MEANVRLCSRFHVDRLKTLDLWTTDVNDLLDTQLEKIAESGR